MKLLPALLAVSLALSGCSKSSPTGPSPTPTPSTTRVLGVAGSLTFSATTVGTKVQREYRVTNSGNATLTISNVIAPSGFYSTLRTATLVPGETQTVHLVFAPEAATTYSGSLRIIGNQTSGETSVPVLGTGIVGSNVRAETFTGEISGGDTRCTSGLSFSFDVGPCKVFEFTTTQPGRVDALLIYNGDDALLSLEIYNPSTGDQVSRGDLVFDPYPGNGEYREMSTNLATPGRYQFRVTVISSSRVTTFRLITTRPN
ncbi:MAG: DUF1573 domain-containing protein [Acidobacteria bacterium]|nr:DUF1573 domain-containing protein [Acidobacteriota bacterium]